MLPQEALPCLTQCLSVEEAKTYGGAKEKLVILLNFSLHPVVSYRGIFRCSGGCQGMRMVEKRPACTNSCVYKDLTLYF